MNMLSFFLSHAMNFEVAREEVKCFLCLNDFIVKKSPWGGFIALGGAWVVHYFLVKIIF